jgi:hypothetical protein
MTLRLNFATFAILLDFTAKIAKVSQKGRKRQTAAVPCKVTQLKIFATEC